MTWAPIAVLAIIVAGIVAIVLEADRHNRRR